jgi:hypothetical protein
MASIRHRGAIASDKRNGNQRRESGDGKLLEKQGFPHANCASGSTVMETHDESWACY